MAINQLRFVDAPREQKEQKPQKLSDLEKVLQGLQIVQAGFGIASDVTKIMGALQTQEQAGPAAEADLAYKKAVTEKTQKETSLMQPPQKKVDTLDVRQTNPTTFEETLTTFQRTPEGGVKPDPISKVSLGVNEALKKSTQEANAAAAKAQKESVAKNESELRNQYDKPTNRTQGMLEAYAKVRSASEAETGPAGLTFLVNYMKMIDPTSVVKEGEVATAQNSGGVPDSLRQIYNKAIGSGLSLELKQQFMAQADGLMKNQLAIQQMTNDFFKPIIAESGLDPTRVIRFEGATLEDLVSKLPAINAPASANTQPAATASTPKEPSKQGGFLGTAPGSIVNQGVKAAGAGGQLGANQELDIGGVRYRLNPQTGRYEKVK